MRITSKGQVTIPADIREKMGFLPNTEVEFKLRGNGVYLEKVNHKSRRGKAIIARMRGSCTVKMTTDEIMRLTRE